MRASFGASRVRAGESDKVYLPDGWRYKPLRRVVLWLHGAGGGWQIGPAERWLIDRVGAPWVCCDLGGPNTWMGTAVLDAIDDAFEWAVANLGVMDDGFVGWGGSMGGGNLLQYGIERPGNLHAAGVAIPALDPEFVRAGNVAGNRAAIEAVHGVGTVPAGKQTYQRGAEWPDVPLAMWYSENDGYTPRASSEAFAGLAGAESYSLGAVAHSYETQLYQQPRPLNFLREQVA